MMLRLLPLLFILSILFPCHWTPAEADGVVRGRVGLVEPFHEMISSRKLGEFTLDYDYGGPNKKHDPIPTKGKPGIGGAKGP